MSMPLLPFMLCVATSSAIVQSVQQPPRSFTALSSCILLHQSASLPSFKTPKSLNSSTSFSPRIFVLMIIKIPLPSLYCNSRSEKFSPSLSLSFPPPFAFNAPPPSPPSVWFCVSDHHSFDPLRLSPQESNCSNKSREVLRCILLAPCRADGKRRSHKVRNIQT